MGVSLPETRYARSGDVMVAYQVVGGGPFDVVIEDLALAGMQAQGPIEALLLAMAGRPAALGELHGAGLSSLAARI